MSMNIDDNNEIQPNNNLTQINKKTEGELNFDKLTIFNIKDDGDGKVGLNDIKGSKDVNVIATLLPYIRKCTTWTQQIIDDIANKLSKSDKQEIKAISISNFSKQRNVQSYGTKGSYAIADTENGYALKQNISVNLNANKVAIIFLKGFNMMTIKPNSNGEYRFRGVHSSLASTFEHDVSLMAQKIARHTEIYNDIQARQKSGETLTSGEQKFISDYKNLLDQNGLQISKNGELEDISK